MCIENEFNTGQWGNKILVLGDSITNFGNYLSVVEYYFTRYLPGIKPEIINLGVSSETVSGLSEAVHPFPRPCVLGRVQRALAEVRPDTVITCYGINDGIYQPFSKHNLEAFQKGYRRLLSEIQQFDVKTVVMTPPVFDKFSFEDSLLQNTKKEEYSYMHPYEDYDDVMERYAEFVMTELADSVDKAVDIYHPMKEEIDLRRKENPVYRHGDGIHPSLSGHIKMAEVLLKALYNRDFPNLEKWVMVERTLYQMVHDRSQLMHNYLTEWIGHDNPNKLETCGDIQYKEDLDRYNQRIEDELKAHPTPVVIIENWNHFTKRMFVFEGYVVTVVEPLQRRSDNAWIWRTEFFDAFAYVDLEMVRRGFCLVHINLANQYGCEEATAVMKRFEDYITMQFTLNSRPVLLGFSRGGLYAVSYALACPDKTSVLYLDAPVLDVTSWPGGLGKGIGSKNEWEECKNLLSLSESSMDSMDEWAKERINRLAETKIPLVIVAGDSDEVVPYEENGARLAAAYRERGGSLLEIIKPGVGHHPHSLEDPQLIADFIERKINADEQ